MKLSQTLKFMPALLMAIIASLSAVAMSGQVQTQSSTSAGQAAQEVKVERGEVVYVSGNDVVVKMEDGRMLDVPNVPEDARIMVDGQQLGVHDLKPGMKLERTITTTTTPQTVTTVQSVTGKVWQIYPPSSVILSLQDGTNQQFTIPKGQKFNVDGRTVDASGLRRGMTISATKITEEPVTVVDQQKNVTGTMPPPPPAPPANVPILVVATPQAAPPTLEQAAVEPTPEKLPQTASNVPLVGLLGLVCLSLAAVLKFGRRSGSLA
ncbi:MAG TPA: LPXTG cell wall anchor domain-containing protein [Candidatus Angelobacter sp.]